MTDFGSHVEIDRRRDQVAGARSKTEYDLSGVKKESDPTATKNPDVLGRDR